MEEEKFGFGEDELEDGADAVLGALGDDGEDGEYNPPVDFGDAETEEGTL